MKKMRRGMWMALGSALLLIAATASAATTKSGGKAGSEMRWQTQTLSGKVVMVQPADRLLIIRDSSGTPFDLVVTRATRIEAGAQKETLAQLTPNESVTVRLIPEAQGDIAASVKVDH
jgi:hypothetical protein